MQLQENILFDNRYQLIRMLGCGGFSEVWLVEDTKVGNKKMALKVYAPGTGLDEDGVKLFSSEFELVFDLNHTNLLRPAFFSVCERSPYLLMPFSEQGSASKYVGKMSEADAWRFIHDVAAGLAYLHLQEPPIIHQDIKPDNVLKDNIGNYQITDFGISTKVRSTLRKSMSSNVKSAGTVAYMPPERFGKDNLPIKASDIWALGATVYELLTGDMPFGEHGGLIQKSGAEIPDIRGEWSDDLREIIARCLRKDTWDRPVAQQIVDWTDKHLKGEKIIFDTPKEEPKVEQEQEFVLETPKPKSSLNLKDKKVLFGIAGGVLVLLLVFAGIKIFSGGDNRSSLADSKSAMKTEEIMDENPQPPAWLAEYDRIMELARTAYESGDYEKAKQEYQAALDLVVRNQGNSDIETTVKNQLAACDKAIEEKAKTEAASTAASSTPATPPAWVAEYESIIKVAQSSYNSKDYAKALTEYNKALTLANQNRDRQKITFVNNQIAACNKALESANSAAAAPKASQEEIDKRLALYNFVGNFALGTNYYVVQKKADNRWGIIDKEGNERVTATYSQVSARLKNGNYALRNESGWVVFDTSLKIVASGLKDLSEYQ